MRDRVTCVDFTGIKQLLDKGVLQKCIYLINDGDRQKKKKKEDSKYKQFLEAEMATHSIFLPGKSHGQRSLAGYSPWGLKESDMTE